MAKLLFTHSYFYKLDPKQWGTHTPYPPLGTLIAAANMRQYGHEVLLFDSNLSSSPDEIDGLIKSSNPDYVIIYDDCFNYLTKMCLTNMREAAFTLIKIARVHGCKIIVSGSDSSDQYPLYLEKGADYVILGEGERTLKELVSYIEKKARNFDDICGISYKNGNKIIKTRKRHNISDLDSLPFPAWDLADINKYRNIWLKSNKPFTLNIATTRGCPYRCAWCAKPVYGYNYHMQSPEKTIAEIEFLINQYNVRNFWICDDIFGLQSEWLGKFKDIIADKRLKFNYVIQSRADILLRGNTIDILAETGLKEVWIGAESGSQKILDAMDKGINVNQIYEVTRKLKQKRIDVGFFIQLGYLGETKRDISKTIKMINRLMPSDIGVSISYPLPGTKFYNQVKYELKNKSNWRDSDDLALMFRGTFSNNYYKKLHRFIHKQFRWLQAMYFIQRLITGKEVLNYRKIRIIYLSPFYMLASVIYFFQLRLLQLKKI